MDAEALPASPLFSIRRCSSSYLPCSQPSFQSWPVTGRLLVHLPSTLKSGLRVSTYGPHPFPDRWENEGQGKGSAWLLIRILTKGSPRNSSRSFRSVCPLSLQSHSLRLALRLDLESYGFNPQLLGKQKAHKCSLIELQIGEGERQVQVRSNH